MEFKEAMMEHNRMCNYYQHGCEDCPLHNVKSCDPADFYGDEKKLSEWEAAVKSWSLLVPKPLYPTIRELIDYILMHMYGTVPVSPTPYFDKRIPEHIAKEFNLTPINEGGLNKYVN